MLFQMAKSGGQEWVQEFNSGYRRDSYMKRTFLLLAIGTLGAWTTAAQTAAPAQAGPSAQPQTALQTNNSGAQASGSGSATASSTMSSPTSPTANGGNSSVSISNGTKIDATLATSLDAKRSKPGEEVEARTEEDIKQDGKVVLKKGTHLVGHVTQAQARAGAQTQSQLGIVFDHAVLKDGQEVPFSASIQALASAQSAAGLGAGDRMASGSGMSAMQGSARGGGGLVGGVTSSAGATAAGTTGTVMNTSSSVPMNAGGTVNTVARSSGAVGGLTSMGRLTPNSSGVFGLEGLSIDSAASSAMQGSTIVSTTNNVHLDSGTQLLLRTTGQTQ
jgi:hypothetical protein